MNPVALIPAGLGAAAAAAVMWAVAVPIAHANGTREGIAQERERQAALVLSETLRQRESVRAAEAEHDVRMSDLEARIDAARPGRDQEILRHEQDRIASGRGCSLSADDIEWLRRR